MNRAVKDEHAYQMIMLDAVRRWAADFVVLPFHIDILHFPLIRDFAARTVTTLHGRLDIPALRPFYVAFPEFPMVSISDAQRQPMPPVNWIGTVHNGLPRNLQIGRASCRESVFKYV